MSLQVDRESGVPIGTQLAWALSERISAGTLKVGDKLPSVRELAAEAGVNVNTVRAVYARLERDGLVRSEQGRGTFVAHGEQADDVAVRRDLRRRIAMLEAELVRRPQLPAEAATEGSGGAGRLATTEELAQIHDDLMARLERLDADRAEIVRRLEQLRTAASLEELAPAPSEKRSSASLKGARVRWVGA
jgi:DNA-binding transcriptional regulator YhcF (GntR family)